MYYLFGDNRRLFHHYRSHGSRGFDDSSRSWCFNNSGDRCGFHNRGCYGRGFFNNRSRFNNVCNFNYGGGDHFGNRRSDNGYFWLCGNDNLSDSFDNRAGSNIGLSCCNQGSGLLGSFFGNGFSNDVLGQRGRGLQGGSNGFRARDGDHGYYRLFGFYLGSISLGSGSELALCCWLLFITLAAGIFVDALATLAFDTLGTRSAT